MIISITESAESMLLHQTKTGFKTFLIVGYLEKGFACCSYGFETWSQPTGVSNMNVRERNPEDAVDRK
jgi:hypothetical protein